MKKLLCMLLCAALLCSMTACGKESESKSGKQRDPASNEKVTPTEGPEVSPTVSPEATPTPEPTPSLPKVVAAEGPLYAIGSDPYAFEYYSDHYTGEGAAFQNNLEYIYLLEKNYDKLADRLFKENQKAAEYAAATRKDAAALLAQTNEKFDYAWFIDSKIELCRTDSVVFSYKRNYSTYLGGAHPFSYSECFNIDTAEGTTIALGDYVKDTASLADIVIAKIKNQGNENALWDGWEKNVFAGVSDGNVQWNATEEGVSIWYNPGDLGAYAAGTILIYVDILEYPELFAEKYIGAYGDNVLPETTHHMASEDLSGFYVSVLPELCKGVGSATWKDIKEILDSKEVAYEGMDDVEARECEMQPFFRIKGEKDEFYLYFFPMPGAESRTSILSSVDIRWDEFESFALVQDYYHQKTTQYEFIDWATHEFPIGPAFDSFRDMLNVLFAEIHYGHNRVE